MLASHITSHRLQSLISELAAQLATDGGVTLSTISKISVSGRTLTISTTDGNEHSAPLPDGISREEFATELEGVMGREDYERDRNGIVTALALKADAAWVRQIIENLPQQTGTQEPVDSILSLSTEGNDLVLTLTSGKVHKVTLPQPEVDGELVTLDQLKVFTDKLEETATKTYVDEAVSAAVPEDTGWVDIAHIVPPMTETEDGNFQGVFVTSLKARRIGKVVFLSVLAASSSEMGTGRFLGNLPPEFQAEHSVATGVPMFSVFTDKVSHLSIEGDMLHMSAASAEDSYTAYISYPATDTPSIPERG